jgi:hypothetical protein
MAGARPMHLGRCASMPICEIRVSCQESTSNSVPLLPEISSVILLQNLNDFTEKADWKGNSRILS